MPGAAAVLRDRQRRQRRRFRSVFAGGPSDPKADGEGEFGALACSGSTDHIRCIDLEGGLCDDVAGLCAPADFITNKCAEALAVGPRSDDPDAPFILDATGNPTEIFLSVVDVDGNLSGDATTVIIEGEHTDVTVTSKSFVDNDGLSGGNQDGFMNVSVQGTVGVIGIAVIDDDGFRSNAACVFP